MFDGCSDMLCVSEKIINGDPHVKCSVMFGRGKFNTGVVIEPAEGFKFDPSDKEKLSEFRTLIWYARLGMFEAPIC